MADESDIDQQPLFGSWLRQTKLLQTVSFGQDPALLEGADRADFITWNFAAFVIELGEAMGEFPGWKPWVAERGQGLNREAFIAELVDALHFAGNMLAAVDCSDEEFNIAYLKKMAVNAARMAAGNYDGISDKCKHCHRELVESTTDEGETVLYCPRHGRS